MRAQRSDSSAASQISRRRAARANRRQWSAFFGSSRRNRRKMRIVSSASPACSAIVARLNSAGNSKIGDSNVSRKRAAASSVRPSCISASPEVELGLGAVDPIAAGLERSIQRVERAAPGLPGGARPCRGRSDDRPGARAACGRSTSRRGPGEGVEEGHGKIIGAEVVSLVDRQHARRPRDRLERRVAHAEAPQPPGELRRVVRTTWAPARRQARQPDRDPPRSADRGPGVVGIGGGVVRATFAIGPLEVLVRLTHPAPRATRGRGGAEAAEEPRQRRVEHRRIAGSVPPRLTCSSQRSR